MNLLQQAEQEFDKRFSYNQQQTESIDYLNTVKNNSITEQLEQNIQSSERETKISHGNNIDNLLFVG